MTTDAKSICHDHSPHLRRNFTTCSKPCVQPQGHRPGTAHQCEDGHEWSVDEDVFIAMPPMSEP
jgi:hypothetical protein